MPNAQEEAYKQALAQREAEINAVAKKAGRKAFFATAAITAVGFAVLSMALTAIFPPAGLGAVAAITATNQLLATGIASVLFGTIMGAASSLAARSNVIGFERGREQGAQEATQAIGQEIAMAQAMAMERQQGKGQKKAMDFSDMPDHPAHKAKQEKTVQGTHTQRELGPEETAAISASR